MSNLGKNLIPFKDLYFQLYGIQLTDIEVTEMSQRILSLTRLSLQAIK